jgi:hypothetical protein
VGASRGVPNTPRHHVAARSFQQPGAPTEYKHGYDVEVRNRPNMARPPGYSPRGVCSYDVWSMCVWISRCGDPGMVAAATDPLRPHAEFTIWPNPIVRFKAGALSQSYMCKAGARTHATARSPSIAGMLVRCVSSLRTYARIELTIPKSLNMLLGYHSHLASTLLCQAISVGHALLWY